MASKLGLNPWTSIWFQPRKTIRAIIDYNPRLQFFLLSFIYGLPMMFHAAQSLSLSESMSFGAVLITAIILAIFAGMIGIYVVSGLLFWTGKWIGGKSSFINMRAAVTWSNVPCVVTIASWIVLLGVFGARAFMVEFPESPFMGGELAVAFLVFLVQAAAGIWGFIMLLHVVGEVQGFSAWRGLLNVIIAFVVFSIAIFIVLGLTRWISG